MASSSLGHRAPLLWLVLPMAAGLALAKAGHVDLALTATLGITLLASAGACYFSSKPSRLWSILLCLGMLFAGISSYTLHRSVPPDWSALPPREAQLQLEVTRAYGSPYPNRAAGLATIIGTDPHLADLIGQKVFYSLRLEDDVSSPLLTAEIDTLGVLEPLPLQSEPNSFENYLSDSGITFQFRRGQVIGKTQLASAYRRFCARTADRFDHILKLGVAEKRPELANITSAMLLGRKAELSDKQDELFMQSGTMHLFAISGLHIGVIALAIHALLLITRLPRFWRFGISFIALGLYVAITGNTPSAVRAFAMVTLLQTSYLFRLPGNPLSALTASALIVLCIAPEQLFTASFQMSYGIVTAILLLGLPLGERMNLRWSLFELIPESTWNISQKIFATVWRSFLATLAIGLSSILFSMLAGVQYFGLLTPGALLANLILIPIASLVILSGMASLLCGLIGFTTGTLLFNHAAVLILAGIDGAIRQFVTWPGVYHAATFKAEWIGPWAFVVLLGTIFYGYATRWDLNRGGWWPPFIVVAITLIFGVNFG